MDHFEAQGPKDAVVMASGALKTIAVSLFKIANDIRFLGSGPTSGIGEIRIPELQPGSSIMPGKVNPVMSEMVMMVAARVVGNDHDRYLGRRQRELRAECDDAGAGPRSPLVDRTAVQRRRCLPGQGAWTGSRPTKTGPGELLERNAIIVTALNPHIGYDNGAKIAKESLATGRSIRELVLEAGLMSPDELDAALDLKRMTEGGVL